MHIGDFNEQFSQKRSSFGVVHKPRRPIIGNFDHSPLIDCFIKYIINDDMASVRYPEKSSIWNFDSNLLLVKRSLRRFSPDRSSFVHNPYLHKENYHLTPASHSPLLNILTPCNIMCIYATNSQWLLLGSSRVGG